MNYRQLSLYSTHIRAQTYISTQFMFMWINFNQSIIYSVLLCVHKHSKRLLVLHSFLTCSLFFCVLWLHSPFCVEKFAYEFFLRNQVCLSFFFALAWRRCLKKRHRAPPNPVFFFFFFISNNLILLFAHWRHNMRVN